MKTPLKCEQGLTLLSIAFILFLIGFFVLLGLKIIPIYLDHNKVKNALTALEKDPGFEEMSEYEIRRSLDKRFNVNYVYDVTQDDIKVIKTGGYTKVEIEYETVKKLAFNLSVLAEFHDEIEAGQE